MRTMFGGCLILAGIPTLLGIILHITGAQRIPLPPTQILTTLFISVIMIALGGFAVASEFKNDQQSHTPIGPSSVADRTLQVALRSLAVLALFACFFVVPYFVGTAISRASSPRFNGDFTNKHAVFGPSMRKGANAEQVATQLGSTVIGALMGSLFIGLYVRSCVMKDRQLLAYQVVPTPAQPESVAAPPPMPDPSVIEMEALTLVMKSGGDWKFCDTYLSKMTAGPHHTTLAGRVDSLFRETISPP